MDIRYRYAFDEAGNVVDIEDVNDGNRHDHTYRCISCGEIVIPRLGNVRKRHFAHKVDTDSCSGETYLHRLSKILIRNKFYSDRKFELCLTQTTKCSRKENCPFYSPYQCHNIDLKTFNLKDYYDTCEDEVTVGGKYVADLLLTDSQNPGKVPVLIEIKVSHGCTEEKTESGLKIIEVDVQSDDDLREILHGTFKDDHRCRLFGFSKNAKPEELKIPLPRFFLYPNGTSYVDRTAGDCQNIRKKLRSISLLELTIEPKKEYRQSLNSSHPIDEDVYIQDVYERMSISRYDIGYAYAQCIGFDKKPCLFCKYRRETDNSIYSASTNFCCLSKNYQTPKNPPNEYGGECPFYAEDKHKISLIRKVMDCYNIIEAD